MIKDSGERTEFETGFVRDMQFAVTEQGEDFVTLTLHETPETRQVFPFAFASSAMSFSSVGTNS